VPRYKALVAALAATLVLAPGCSRELNPVSLVNQPPEVHFVGKSTPALAKSGLEVTHDLRWIGSDPDGRIDHYLVAVDPHSIDDWRGWMQTNESSRALAIPSRRARAQALRDAPERASQQGDFTVFAVRAVDDRGEVSNAAVRAMFGENVAPSATILSPPPGHLIIVPNRVRIRWTGIDPDGPTGRPVQYKYRLFASGPPPADFPFPVSEADFLVFLTANPDSLRRGYAPKFPGWTTVSGDTTEVLLEGLVPQTQYVFVITAIDEAGDYDPFFSLNTNMLQLYATFDENAAPILSVFNESFHFEYPVGGRDYAIAHPVQVPFVSDQSVTIHWDAFSQAAFSMARTRWSIAADGSPPPGENGPVLGSSWAPWQTSQHLATVGPFPDGQPRLLFIEVEDELQLRSLAVVRLIPTIATRKRPLLIVDDTRFLVDDAAPGGGVRPPAGTWPTAAELDSFLFAIGGFPWNSYPAGTMSPTGRFAGYSFDTLGTRSLGSADMTVPLATLARYEHVIWITDLTGAGNTRSGLDRIHPTTSLRYMASPNHFNTLAAYVQQGGRVWLVGAGIARASLEPSEGSAPNPGTWSVEDGDLGPGRMLYDQAHLRSGIRLSSLGHPVRSDRAIGGWPGAPNYAAFPTELRLRSAATDPVLPPLRTNPSLFYPTTASQEQVFEPNTILEGGVSVLDTIYESHGNGIPIGEVRPVMTLYHGSENAQVLYSGHDLWKFATADVQQVVDAVLQGVWGLSPGAAPTKSYRGKAPVTVNTARPSIARSKH